MKPSIFSSSRQSSPALIITYNPSPGFEYQLEKLFAEFEQVILVDNGSSPKFQKTLKSQAIRWGDALKILINQQNLGVGTALNQGFAWAIQNGYDFIITLDQDSTPAPGMSKALVSALGACAGKEKISIVAPLVENPDAGITVRYIRPKNHLFFERTSCAGQILDNVSIVITSGSMYNLAIYKQVGPFRDDFFIDYVDTEYCLRAKQQGFKIIVACDAHLRHKLGNQKKINFGPVEMRPTFHSITRWYYINRNRIFMLRKYGVHFPHWLLYELTSTVYGLLRMLLFEDHKSGKMLAALLGSLDGLSGQSGAIPISRQKILSKFE